MQHKNHKFLLVILLILFTGISSVYAQFKGKMTFYGSKDKRTFNVFSSDIGYRYDFDEDGRKGAVIVKQGTKEVIILMPQQKMAMINASDSPMSMANDPLLSYKYYQESGIFKKEGEETVNGVPCTKSVLYNKDNPSQKMFTMWYSEKYKFPMKMINHIDGSEDTGMEMTEIESWEADPSKFEIPSDFRVMDMPNTMPGK